VTGDAGTPLRLSRVPSTKVGLLIRRPARDAHPAGLQI
jgi:hypothetical protein